MVDALVADFGTAGAAREYDYSGKTDPQIVRDLLRGAGISDERIDAGMAAVLEDYRRRLARPPSARARPRQARGRSGGAMPWPRTPA